MMALTERTEKQRPKILIILHQETSIPGRVGTMLEKRGFRLDIKRPRFGDQLPHRMEDHAGAVIFGGPMSANDPDAFIKREIDWISVPLKEQKPFLGICLGGQMLAKQLGASVKAHPKEQVEIGYYPIHATEVGKTMMTWPSRVYQWHREGFDLPKQAELLATGHDFPNQAYRYGPNAYGIQFHPEVTLRMMMRWTTVASDRLKLPGARNRRNHYAGRLFHDPAVERWLKDFLDLWLPSNTKD